MREEDLTPVQYLLMECVASRIRMGEHIWTFPKKSGLTAHLKILEKADLIGWKYNTYNDLMVWLTTKGRKMFLTSDYIPPVLNSGNKKCSAQECHNPGVWEWEGIADVRMTMLLNVHCIWWFCNEHDAWHRTSEYKIQGRPLQEREL
jgi:hypothetical protein